MRHQDWQLLVFDLDRCEHGRHEGDWCSGCNGPSLGNPFMGGSRRVEPFSCRQIGFNISGDPIAIPEVLNDRFGTPGAWSLDGEMK